MTQGKRSGGMIKGAMSDFTAIRRICNPELREKVRPPISVGQIYGLYQKTFVKILEIHKQKIKLEVIKGKVKDKIAWAPISMLTSGNWYFVKELKKDSKK